MNFNLLWNKNASRVAVIYLFISLVWIFFSDKLLVSFFPDHKNATHLHTLKGWFFVFVTTLVIYFLVRNAINKKNTLIINLEQTRKKLSESENKYRQLFDNALVGMIVTNLSDGKLLDCNIQFLLLAGYESKEQAIAEMSIKDHYYDYKQRNIIVTQLKENGKIENYEMQFYRRNRELLWVEVSYYLDKVQSRIEVVIKDIDQRKRAEQALKQSEENYKSLFVSAGDAAFVIQNGKYIDCNERANKILKTSKENILELTPWDISPLNQPDGANSKQKAAKMFKEAIEGGRHEFEWQHKNFKNKLLDVEVSLSVIDAEKNVFISIWRDITERKRAEQALKTSEDKYSRLYNNALVGLSVTSSDEKKIIECNLRLAKLFGYNTKEEAIKNLDTYKVFYDPNQREIILQVLLDKGVVEAKQIQFVKSDKTFFWGSASFSYNPDTKFIESVIVDITDKKIAEKTLLLRDESLRKLNTAVEQSGNLIFITSKEGIIEYANKQFTEVTGFSSEDVVGKKPNLLKSGKHSDKFYKNMWTTILSGNIWKGELQNRKKNGEIYWESALITPVFNAKKEIINFIAIKQDITQSKQTEQRIFNTIIETEERERRRFAEDLHDELGPYLSGVKLYVDRILRKEINTEERKEVAHNLNAMIDESITKTREISNRLMPSILMDFGLIKALDSYIDKINATEKLHIEFTAQNTDLKLNQTIEVVIYRIIIELINNTLKYAKAKKINLEIEKTDELIISYSDNGIGYDLNKELERKSGLGLTNLINRLETIKGSYEFNSRPGIGSEYQFKLNLL